MYKDRKIGVFISHIYGPYQKELCQGVIDKASSYGYRVEVFSSNDGEDFGYNKTGESSILRIPNFEKYAGIIFASSTYVVAGLRDRIYETLKKKCTCPIIEVNQFSPKFPCVSLDNNIATIPIVEHLIKTHNHKKICYLGNTKETYFSDSRYNYYLKAMKDNNLSMSKNNYYQTDFSSEGIENAIDFFLDGDEIPDAIVCYNDNMALKVMTSLMKRGYKIPEDIAITGYDTLEFGQRYCPTLTSVSFPIKELGYTSVENLIKLINKKSIEPHTIIKADPSIGSSCGCENPIKENPLIYSHNLLKHNESMENDLINDINMSSILHGINNIDQGMDLLEKYVELIDNCYEFYLCLYSNWDLPPSHIRKITNTQDSFGDNKSVLLKLAIKDGKLSHECSFSYRNPLPDYIYENSKSAFIYSPLFFNELEFGYIAISYKENKLSYKFNFNSWMMNVNRMLKHIYDTRQMRLLVDRLESIHNKDELTGLYNSYSFNQLSNQLINKAKKNNDYLILTIFDLDNTRSIMENFGYKKLNFAIQIVGHALKSSLDNSSICSHMFNGRFYVLSKNPTNEAPTKLIESVKRYLDNYNRLQTKEYPIIVSYGYNTHEATPSLALDDLLENAQKNMYIEKDKKN